MQHWIQEICEPKKLILAWQAPEPAERYRWAVAEVLASPQLQLRYFRPGPEFEENNHGRSYSSLKDLGFRGYPAFDDRSMIHREGVEAAFMRRLPPRSREDFAEYIQRFRLRPEIPLSNLALLGRTEAKLPSDGFGLVDPLDPGALRCDLLFEIAGFRYYADDLRHRLMVGDPVSVVADNENAHDRNAVAIHKGDELLGYVNRLQAKTFRSWLATRHVEGWIERLNGNAERPRAFVFAQIRPLAVQEAA